MPDTVIERVARALHQIALRNGGESRGPDAMRGDAKEIIAAMRDPTEMMLESAAYSMPGVLKEQNEENERLAWRLWHRMIDAALAEQP